jgi:hypothetical protein
MAEASERHLRVEGVFEKHVSAGGRDTIELSICGFDQARGYFLALRAIGP